MMKKYQKPEIEVIEFAVEETIMTSTVSGEGTEDIPE